MRTRLEVGLDRHPLVISVVVALGLTGLARSGTGQTAAPSPVPDLASPAPVSDERFKADLLVVTAHPDDDTLVASYLARAVGDEGRRAAVVICNDGSGGGNAVGPERGAALGLVRRIEAR